ncbi:LysR family transcriptional regulator [Saccharomonospora saliphila]|uniref:LysR family transcriptional regulator n=1 Tax=Saccharomonospora saliphila TaxID=369829 RepID=UPI00036E6C1B|nr:LysR family transcriptional regulator [Saccharomonospora saliphila]
MELRQLSYFRTVAEVRSFSRAAAVLHMTQPSLSRQIMALERELGHELLERTPHGVEPTPAGLGLLDHLDTVFEQVERIPEVVRTAAGKLRLVRIGVPQGLPQPWGFALLDRLGRHLPDVRVSLHEATTEEQRQLLQNGTIDLGLLHTDAQELRCELLFTQRMGVAVPSGSALAERSTISFAELDGLTVMAHAAGEVDVEVSRVQRASAAAGARTEWLFRRFSEHSWLIALASEVDAVLVTHSSARRHLPDWSWIPVKDLDAGGTDLDIRTWAAWRDPVPSHVRAVVDVMRSVPDETRTAVR